MRRQARKFGAVALGFALCAAACGTSPAQDLASAPRAGGPHSIAHRTTVAGVANFAEVTPTLYRGAQPTKEGLETLAKMGVNIVVDLREGGEGKREEKEVRKSGMEFVAIPWECGNPKDDYFAKFLTVLRDNRDKKVFVHCHLGVDRTGMMIAAYRMSEQGWTAEEARREMQAFGFSPWHRFLCSGLSSYERQFPGVVGSSPAFQNLRAGDPKPPLPPEPKP